MNKRTQKGIATVLTAAMTVTATVPAFAETNTIDYTIPSMSEHVATYNNAELEGLRYTMVGDESREIGAATPRAAIAAGAYFIPGIGQVLLAATGAITVAGVTIAVGSVLYNTIMDFLSDIEEREIAAIKAKIPSRLRTDSGDVDLSKFDQKVSGSSVKRKEKGGWTIEKDTSGHGGSAWKLKDTSGKRIASLGEDGKVLRD